MGLGPRPVARGGRVGGADGGEAGDRPLQEEGPDVGNRALPLAAAAFGGLLGAASALGLTVVDIRERASVLVRDGDRAVMEYRYGQVPFKPYVLRLLSPEGVNVLRDAPADHLHHHALMFAVGVDGVDFWSEAKTCGRQVHRSLGEAVAESAPALARAALTDRLDWVGPALDARPLVREERTLCTYVDRSLGATLLDWRSRLAPAEGRPSVRLAGSHYFGLGLRPAAGLDGAAEFFTAAGKADGEVVRGDERLTRGAWMACAGAVDGKAVTIALFDSPANVRPALWFTMARPFAYVSATLNLHREPLALEAGKPLALRYGVAVWDGRAERDQIEGLYRRWLALEASPGRQAP